MIESGVIRAGLLILTLWIHALAPVAALRALDFAADPLAGAVICGASDAGHLAGDPAGDPADPRSQAGCSLCALCVAGAAAAILPDAPVALPTGRWITVSWATPPPAPAIRPPVRSGQPRAPPVSV